VTGPLVQLWRQRRNLLSLIVGDFSQNYLASYLGFAWAIIGPVVSLTVISLVFRLVIVPSGKEGILNRCGQKFEVFFYDSAILTKSQ